MKKMKLKKIFKIAFAITLTALTIISCKKDASSNNSSTFTINGITYTGVDSLCFWEQGRSRMEITGINGTNYAYVDLHFLSKPTSNKTYKISLSPPSDNNYCYISGSIGGVGVLQSVDTNQTVNVTISNTKMTVVANSISMTSNLTLSGTFKEY